MSIYIEKYTEKSIAVFGDTQPHKEKLKELGGKFNSNLRGKAGWIFPLTYEAKVKEYIDKNLDSSSTNVEEDDDEEDFQPKRLLNKPKTQITLEMIMEKLEKMEKAQAELIEMLKNDS